MVRKMSKKEGFWIRLWMDRERCHKKEETFEYLLREDGYDEKDEESLKSLAEDWSRHDKQGYNSEYYRYGFEIVSKPPKEWLEKEFIRLMKKQESLMVQENLIKLELGMIKEG